LSDEDIEKMVKDAEANAESDKKKRELVDAKNQADTMIHSSEKNLTEFGDKVTEDEKAAIEKDVQALKDVMGSDDLEKIKPALEALTQSSMKLSEAMYKEQQATSGATEPGQDSEQPKDENVVDADFEEVNEDTKQA
jgi:molecular chaperone DnaK